MCVCKGGGGGGDSIKVSSHFRFLMSKAQIFEAISAIRYRKSSVNDVTSLVMTV